LQYPTGAGAGAGPDRWTFLNVSNKIFLMLKNYLKTLGLVLMFFFIWSIIVLVFFIPLLNNNPNTSLLIFVLMFAIMVGSFIFYLNFALKASFLIKPESKFSNNKLPFNKLKKRLLNVQIANRCITATEKNNIIYYNYNYNSAEWYNIVGKQKKKETYTLIIKLNKNKNEAVLIDVLKSVTYKADISPSNFKASVELSAKGSRGVYIGYKRQVAYGITKDFKLGQIYNFTFEPSQIKDIAVNTILNAGYKVRFGIW
jgi:hypothetical protein